MFPDTILGAKNKCKVAYRDDIFLQYRRDAMVNVLRILTLVKYLNPLTLFIMVDENMCLYNYRKCDEVDVLAL